MHAMVIALGNVHVLAMCWLWLDILHCLSTGALLVLCILAHILGPLLRSR